MKLACEGKINTMYKNTDRSLNILQVAEKHKLWTLSLKEQKYPETELCDLSLETRTRRQACDTDTRTGSVEYLQYHNIIEFMFTGEQI